MSVESAQRVGRAVTSTAAQPPPTRGGLALRLPYLPGLDGLRAIAVGAVLLYHAGVEWFPGGFLGVEVFFVISGYLITALLLSEVLQRGQIDLRLFWLRRARRLLPALYLLLLVWLAYAVIWLPGEVTKLRGDALAAFAYVENWYFIVRQQSYFEVIGRPSLFQHLWSLAIEEQFYLLWPPLVWLGLRSWTPGRLAKVVGGVAVLSALLMAVLYHPGSDPLRVYFGTDTRASGLLAGCTLALVWAPWRTLGRATQKTILWLDRVGLGAVVALVVLFIVLRERQTFLYRGGFVLVDLVTVTIIAGTVAPGAKLLPWLLDARPMRWVGERSYSLYLCHWPLFAVTRPGIDTRLDGIPLFVLRLLFAVVLADLSYRWLETPIRQGALGRLWVRFRSLAKAPDRRSWRQVQLWSVGVGSLLGAVLALSVLVAAAQPPDTTAEFGSGKVELTVPETTPTPEPAVPVGVPTATGPPPCPAALAKPQVYAIGDSVLVAGAEKLAEYIGEGLTVSAEVGRQASQVPALLRERRQAGGLGAVVILDIGNNGYVTTADFNAIMAELRDVKAVIVVNVRVPREWEKENNTTLASGVKKYPNAVLVDWYATSAGHPEYLKDDGVHPYQVGREVYGRLIEQQLRTLQATWATEGGCVLPPPTP